MHNDRQHYIPRYHYHYHNHSTNMCRNSRCQRRLRLVGNNACVDLPVHTLGLPTPTKPPLTSTGSGRPLPTATTTATVTTTDYTAHERATPARVRSGANSQQRDLIPI